MLTQASSSYFSSSEQFSPVSQPLQPPSSVLRIDRTPIALKQVLSVLRSTRQLQPMLETVVSRYILERIFQQRSDLIAGSAELEQAVEQFKQSFTETEFETWLLEQAWNEEILHQQIEFDLKLTKLKAEVAAPKLLETFMAQKLMLDRVVMSRIVVEDLDTAEELRLLMIEEKTSFEQLARDYSLAADAICNGMMGSLSRAEVQTMLGFDPYQPAPQTLLEPIEYQDQWWLIRIETIQPACLDETVTQQLQEKIFDQWLFDQIQTLEITLQIEN